MKSSAIGNTAMSNGFTSHGRVNVEIGTEPRSWALYNDTRDATLGVHNCDTKPT